MVLGIFYEYRGIHRLLSDSLEKTKEVESALRNYCMCLSKDRHLLIHVPKYMQPYSKLINTVYKHFTEEGGICECQRSCGS